MHLFQYAKLEFHINRRTVTGLKVPGSRKTSQKLPCTFHSLREQRLGASCSEYDGWKVRTAKRKLDAIQIMTV